MDHSKPGLSRWSRGRSPPRPPPSALQVVLCLRSPSVHQLVAASLFHLRFLENRSSLENHDGEQEADQGPAHEDRLQTQKPARNKHQDQNQVCLTPPTGPPPTRSAVSMLLNHGRNPKLNNSNCSRGQRSKCYISWVCVWGGGSDLCLKLSRS